MTPAELERAIAKACAAETLEVVAAAGFAAMEVALGANSPAYLPALDRLCRRMRQFDQKSVARFARRVEPL